MIIDSSRLFKLDTIKITNVKNDQVQARGNLLRQLQSFVTGPSCHYRSIRRLCTLTPEVIRLDQINLKMVNLTRQEEVEVLDQLARDSKGFYKFLKIYFKFCNSNCDQNQLGMDCRRVNHCTTGKTSAPRRL